MPSLTAPSFLNTHRVRSFASRLPLFTRLVLVGIVAAWIVGVQSVWDLRAWGALVPDQTGITTC